MTNSLSEVSPGSMFCQRYLVHHESILYKNQETCTVHWSPLTCKTPSAKWVPARGKQASKALTAQLGSCGVSRTIVGSSVGSAWTSARIRVGKKTLFVGKLLTKKRSRGLLKCTCCGEEWFHLSPLIQTGRRGKRYLSDGGGLIPSAEAEAACLRLYFFITTKSQKQLENQ